MTARAVLKPFSTIYYFKSKGYRNLTLGVHENHITIYGRLENLAMFVVKTRITGRQMQLIIFSHYALVAIDGLRLDNKLGPLWVDWPMY